MKNAADTYIKKFLAQHIERRKFLCVMLMLAVLVSLAVYWRLKYTGIAMTNEVYCGLEEHTHTEDCYENVLVCGFEEGEEVFPSDDTLSGEAVSASIHTHTDECYEKVLICGLEEHTHTVDCLTDHSLDEDQTNEAETAAETETGSEASSEASEAQTTETDGETEVSSDEPGVISDSSEEGSSGGSSDEDSEETEEEEEEEQVYELPSLTGYTLTDFTAAAESQIGYTESKKDYTVSDEAERMGYTVYGEWYGNTYGKWDAMFLSYCLDYAGISDDIFPKNSGAFAWYGELDGLGCYNEKDDYEPIAGDIVFFDLDDDEKPDLVGAVTAVDKDENKITVVEGDFPCDDGYDRVCENGFYLDDETITGYGHIPDEEASAAVIYTAEDENSGVNVKVTAAKEALPEEAELYITLFDESRDEYTAAGEAIGFNSEEANLAVVDIAFSLGGEKTEPTEAVDVSLDISAILPEDADPSTVSITHLAETEEGIEPVLVADATEETEGTIDTEAAVAEFTVDSFSSFTITWKDYDGSSDTVSITVNSYLYRNGQTTTTGISGRAATLLTTLNSEASYNTVDLTSSNGELEVDGYDLQTATVNLVQNGTTISIEDALLIGVSGNSTDGYTYTVTTSSGSVTYENITSASVNLYYSSNSTSSDTELDPTSYDSSAKVYWDIFVSDSSASIGYSGSNSTTGVSSVSMGTYGSTITVSHENSNNTSWSTSTSTLGDYFPNAYAGSTAATSVTEDGIIVIVPETGYYVTHVVIACAATVTGGSGGSSGGGPGGSGGWGGGSSGPGGTSTTGGRNAYSCTTWSEDNAYDTLFTVSASGTMTIDVSSLYFSHNGDDDDIYFILIQVSPIASPLYVQYDYGTIVDILGGSSYSGTAFSSADSWTTENSGNDYGTGDGAQTDYTQYQYAYDNASEVGDWTHYANSITDEAKEEAAAAGYYFAGWYTEYYYDITVTDADQNVYIYTENYTYTFGSDIYTTNTYSEGESVALPTHAKIIAQWEPVALTLTKTVEGLTGTEFESEDHTFVLTLQKYNETTEEWEDYDTAGSVTITGDGSSSVTFSPITPGTYRVIEDTSGIGTLTGTSTTLYVNVATDGSLTITSDQITEGTVSFTYDVTNTYAEGRTEPLPNTGGATPLPYTAAFLIITGFVVFVLKGRS